MHVVRAGFEELLSSTYQLSLPGCPPPPGGPPGGGAPGGGGGGGLVYSYVLYIHRLGFVRVDWSMNVTIVTATPLLQHSSFVMFELCVALIYCYCAPFRFAGVQIMYSLTNTIHP